MAQQGELFSIPDEGHAHLRRLMASWGMLADLCFADLLLFVPAPGPDNARFQVYGQMRPTTSQTLHHEDLVGVMMDEVERPLVARAWRQSQLVEGEISLPSRGERAKIQCIPVRWRGELLAVLTRESALAVGRRPGELERVYVQIFDRFARMILNGEFPFEADEGPAEEAPRVGDGVLVLDSHGRIEYASPNAINALHRMGIYSNTEGMRLDELGVDETAVQRAFFEAIPITEEIERPESTVLLRCIPMLEHSEVTGALVLMRDVTDVRRRDRLLLSKDETIREVHHRVKNNLQTISSLLRLQARRLPPGEGKTALEEAERRIRSIALVHEILSREPGQQVPFGEIVEQVVRMAKDAVVSDRPVRINVSGDAGELPAETATPLAVALTELLQNAVEHAFDPDPDSVSDSGADSDTHSGAEPAVDQTVEVSLVNEGVELVVKVCDNGRGLPDGFTIDDSTSLGLSIVRNLVTGQLDGTIEMWTDGGTTALVRIPLAPQP
ncbi:MAG: two-component system, sensor histidine kinase PdtaS [Acidimicrobiaceae bacterium]|jgi:two-component sensor histidine kinase|nr:two-component system, sensor histidine kinase PdtaS [Acidimicrobiaceae bacterium]